MIHLPKRTHVIAKILLVVCCIAVATIPGFIVAQYGAQTFDEPYQMLNTLDYKNTPIAPLSNWLGNIFGTTFGFEWLSFRYLSLCCYWLSIMIGCVYMLVKTRNYRLFLFLAPTLVYLGGAVRVSHIVYGWDTWTLLGTVITSIVALEFIERKHLWQIMVLGVLTAILALLRIPNVISFAIICGIVFFCSEKSLRIKNTAVYVVSALLAGLALVCALYDTPAEYMSYFAANHVGQHGIIRYISMYPNCIARNIPFMLMLIGGYFVLRHVRKMWPAALLIIYVIAYNLYHYAGEYFYSLYEHELATVMLMLILSYRFNRGTLSGSKTVAYAFLALIPMFGSNTGFSKYVMLPSIPILLIYLYHHLNRQMKVMGICIAASVAVYSVISEQISSFGDRGISDCKYTFSSGLAKGIKTSMFEGEYVSAVINDVAPYAKTHKILVLRHECDYIFEYLLQSRNDYVRHTFDEVKYSDCGYVDWVESQVTCNKNIAVLYFDGPSPMSQMLEKHCSLEFAHDDYKLYIPR